MFAVKRQNDLLCVCMMLFHFWGVSIGEIFIGSLIVKLIDLPLYLLCCILTTTLNPHPLCEKKRPIERLLCPDSVDALVWIRQGETSNLQGKERQAVTKEERGKKEQEQKSREKSWEMCVILYTEVVCTVGATWEMGRPENKAPLLSA